jgi:peroxiredoxin
MSLNSSLSSLKQEIFPQGEQIIEAHAGTRFINQGHISQVIKDGDLAPDFSLPDTEGNELSLKKLLENGPVILTFFRGNWCSFCDLSLRALQASLADFEKHGATLLAISPDTIEFSTLTKEKKELRYKVLSDLGSDVARKYGLVMEVEPEVFVAYQLFGIDIHRDKGNELSILPVPATYVIDTNFKVVYSFVNVDHTLRAEPADIIASLIQLRANTSHY